MTGGSNHEAPHAPTNDATDTSAGDASGAPATAAPGRPPSPRPSATTGAPSGAAAAPGDPSAPGGAQVGPTGPSASSADSSGPPGPAASRNPAATASDPADRSVPDGLDRTAAADGGQSSTKAQGRAGRKAKHPERGYLLAALVVKPVIRTWFRIRLEGEENIPEEGPVILASNHRSNMDPVVLGSAVRRPVVFMAKAELFVGPLGWILRWIGQFPVRRGGIDREALRSTDAVLGRGSVLGLFPEGTRGDGRFVSVHPGLAYIMVRQRCPVVPVAIFGTERVRRRFGWLPFASPVRIVIGPAIDLPQSTGDRAGRRAASELLRQRLQDFLAVAAAAPAAQSTSRQSDE
jgi:1-acyl-sn-glycerol-3-phosphate acyltransferase